VSFPVCLGAVPEDVRVRALLPVAHVCEDRVSERVRQNAPDSPADPVSLADEMRAMALT
jgi:hypothetical protein